MKTQLRLATTDDIPALLALHEEATQDLCRICPNDFGEGLRSKEHSSQERGYFEGALRDSDTVVLVAQKNTEVVGFGLAIIERHGDDFLVAPFLTLNRIAVKRGCRREGVGEAIMAGLEDWGRRNGLTATDLIVFEGNDKAQGLFKKSGYRLIEHRMAKKL